MLYFGERKIFPFLRIKSAFKAVAEKSSRVGRPAAGISAACHAHAQGIEQANHAVTEMDELTRQNAADADAAAFVPEEKSVPRPAGWPLLIAKGPAPDHRRVGWEVAYPFTAPKVSPLINLSTKKL